jgi:hypothetical protein
MFMSIDGKPENRLATRCLRLAGVYLIAGMIMGIFIGISQQFVLAPVHAHVNLLGWATLALAGIVFALWPHTAQTRLARLFFVIYNVSLPIMMVSLTIKFMGNDLEFPLVVGSLGVFLGAVLFVINLFVCPLRDPGV